jgi:hypothetical protein
MSAMETLHHCAHPDSILYGTSPWCPTLPLPSLPTDLSDPTTRQRSSTQTTGLSALSRRDGDASYQP